MYLFSVIVPVYNVEKYIEQCVLSIVNQKFQEFELILINDGTEDSSIKIAERLLENNDKAIILHQKNQGQSVARNLGLKQARGKYIIFVDSDDFIINNSVFSLLAKYIEKNNFPDLILHEETRFFGNGKIHYENNIKKTGLIRTGNFKGDLRKLIFNELFVASPWDKVIKRDILLDNNINFPIGLKSEDMIWTSDLIPFIKTYDCLDFSFYMYRKNIANSITKSVDEKHLKDVISMLKIVLKKNIPSENKIYEAFWAEHYTFLLMNADSIKGNKRCFWMFMEKNQFLLRKGYTKNVDRVYNSYKLFGLRITSKLLIFFRKLNNFNRKYQIVNE